MAKIDKKEMILALLGFILLILLEHGLTNLVDQLGKPQLATCFDTTAPACE